MNRPHNNHPAQINYRAAASAFDAIDNAWEAVDAADSDAMEAHESAWDAAAQVEHQAADKLIRWAWSVISANPMTAQSRPMAKLVVDAALAGRPKQRAQMIDLANRMAV